MSIATRETGKANSHRMGKKRSMALRDIRYREDYRSGCDDRGPLFTFEAPHRS